MDYVTIFALGTLTAVFLLAAGVLITLCWRRKKQRDTLARAGNTFVYSKNRDEKVSNLIELGPILDTELGKCEWVDSGTGLPFDEVLAILRLTTEVVKILSDVSISRAASKIYEVIAQAMFRVDTHFHELLEFTPSEESDIRVIEARALTLTTTVWSLNAAFTLHGFEQAKEVEDRVIKMYEHVDKLRQLIPGYEGGPGGEKKEGGGEGKEQEEEEGDSQVTDETVVDATSGGGGDAIISHEALPSAAAAAAAAAPTTLQQKVEVHQNPDPEDDGSTPKKQSPPTTTSNGSPASITDPPTVSPTPKDTVDTERDPLLSADS